MRSVADVVAEAKARAEKPAKVKAESYPGLRTSLKAAGKIGVPVHFKVDRVVGPSLNPMAQKTRPATRLVLSGDLGSINACLADGYAPVNRWEESMQFNALTDGRVLGITVG